jgi:hypothetical protein
VASGERAARTSAGEGGKGERERGESKGEALVVLSFGGLQRESLAATGEGFAVEAEDVKERRLFSHESAGRRGNTF